MDVRIEIATKITVPDGTVVETASATAGVIGLRLPCGRLVRPWVSYEIEEEGADDDMTYRDLSPDEMTALGIDDDTWVKRVIETLPA